MRGENVEITAQCRDIDAEARHRLTAVEHDLRANIVGQTHRAWNIQHAAQHVRNMRKTDEFMRGGQHRCGGVKVDLAVLGQWADVDFDADTRRQQLPRHDV